MDVKQIRVETASFFHSGRNLPKFMHKMLFTSDYYKINLKISYGYSEMG